MFCPRTFTTFFDSGISLHIFSVPRSFGEQNLETNGWNPKISGLEDDFPFKGADFRLLV